MKRSQYLTWTEFKFRSKQCKTVAINYNHLYTSRFKCPAAVELNFLVTVYLVKVLPTGTDNSARYTIVIPIVNCISVKKAWWVAG